MKKIVHLILLAGLASVLTAPAQTNLAVGANANPPATATNEPAAVPDATATGTAAAPGSGGVIPIIRFDNGVPLTTAIDSLARLAGINYILDPKMGFGQMDQTGHLKAEPALSIRWENITAEKALLALLDNYSLQMVHDKNTGIDRITTKDPAALPALITRVIQLKYSDPATMNASIESVLVDKRSKSLPDSRTTQIIIVATEPEQIAVDTLVGQLDRPTKQVLIETRLIEISSNPSTTKGVDWTKTLGSQNIYFGNGQIDSTKSSTTVQTPGAATTSSTPGGATTASSGASSVQTVINMIQGGGGLSASTAGGLIPSTGFLNADGLHVVLSFLNSSADAQILSTPRVVTLDNEKATISITRGYPVFNVQGGTQNTAGGSSVSYTNVGPVLNVTPRISANDYIWLKVESHVDSFFGQFTQVTGGGNNGGGLSLTAPIFDFRKIETKVFIPNSNTLVLGGLVQDSPQANYTKVPLLGDIPGLGWAFRSENKSLNKQNLLIFITPTIVRDADFQPSISGDFLHSKPATMTEPMNPNKAWIVPNPPVVGTIPFPSRANLNRNPNKSVETNVQFSQPKE